LNRTTALHRAYFSRRRRDGEEISRLTVTYLIAGRPDDHRIAALLLHTP
jgi:uncharacterized NTF2-like protein DUF6841